MDKYVEKMIKDKFLLEITTTAFSNTIRHSYRSKRKFKSQFQRSDSSRGIQNLPQQNQSNRTKTILANR